MNKKTIAIFAVCMLLVSALSVFTTLALLSDTDVVTNTFTSGNVDILLDEAPVDEDGQATEGDRVKNNNYKVYPGKPYDKDPTIKNTGSEDAYVGAKITITNAGALEAAEVTLDKALGFLGISTTGWTAYKSTKVGDTYEYLITYPTALAATATAVVFDGFQVDVKATNTQVAALNNLQIKVDAYAVQEETYASAEAALEAGFSTVFTKA